MTNKFKSYLFQEVNASSIGLFRICLGIILLIHAFYFLSPDWFNENIVNPKLHFPFYYFSFLKPLPPSSMKLVLVLMAASSVFIIIGKFFKPAVFIYGLVFTFTWLVDKSYFNNHYYFITLLTLLLLVSNADRWGGLNKKNVNVKVPQWQIFLLKAQIFVVFFIAGVNKLNYYWMFEFQPMRHILETKAQIDGTTWVNSTTVFALFSWLGLLFDLSIGFLLWVKKTRKAAIIFYVAFNLLNFWIFRNIGEIGLFPFLLLACLTIFLEPEWVQKKFSWLSKKDKDQIHKNKQRKTNTNKQLVFMLVIVYVLIQILLPFRHYLYKGHVDWTGRGQRFAWRMKLMYKVPEIHFYLMEEGSDQKREVNLGFILNDKQYTNLIYYPDFIPAVAKHIKMLGIKDGLKNPRVVADFWIGFMGHKKKMLVNPDTDLSTVEFVPYKHPDWLLIPEI